MVSFPFRVPSLNVNVPEMRALVIFCRFYQTVTMRTMTVTKISTSVLTMYFQVA